MPLWMSMVRTIIRFLWHEVTHDGAVLGKGSGKSKKEAEQNAANDALERMNQAKK